MSSSSEQEEKEAQLNLMDEVRKLAVAIDHRLQQNVHVIIRMHCRQTFSRCRCCWRC